MPNTYTITVTGASSAQPNGQSIGTGPVTIIWNLTSGLSWTGSGISIQQNSTIPTSITGSRTWQGGAPSLSGSSYVLSFTNNMSGTYSFPYNIGVLPALLRDTGSSPVIQNEGGGTPYPPDKPRGFDPDKD